MQRASNRADHREDLTKSQLAAAVAGLFDLGLNAAQVATALHVRKDYADKAGRAGRSERARRQLDDRQLTLEGAALLADLEDAAQGQAWIADAIDKVIERGYGIEYQLRNLGRRIDERAEVSAAADECTARGFTLLHDEPSTKAGDRFSLADLRSVDGDAVPADVPEQTPHLWHIYVLATGSVWVGVGRQEDPSKSTRTRSTSTPRATKKPKQRKGRCTSTRSRIPPSGATNTGDRFAAVTEEIAVLERDLTELSAEVSTWTGHGLTSLHASRRVREWHRLVHEAETFSTGTISNVLLVTPGFPKSGYLLVPTDGREAIRQKS